MVDTILVTVNGHLMNTCDPKEDMSSRTNTRKRKNSFTLIKFYFSYIMTLITSVNDVMFSSAYVFCLSVHNYSKTNDFLYG